MAEEQVIKMSGLEMVLERRCRGVWPSGKATEMEDVAIGGAEGGVVEGCR